MENAKFGFSQITKTTPDWAKMFFKIIFGFTTIIIFVVAADPAISDLLKVRLNVYLNGFSMAVFLVSRLFGVEVKKTDSQIQD